MILSRAPLRVSFIGGGSDYPEFFSSSEGTVVGTALRLYSHCTISNLAENAPENFRISYRQVESVECIDEIENSIVRELLYSLNWAKRISISTFADMPVRSGLGGSSAFTVALYVALEKYRGNSLDSRKCAEVAVEIERDRVLDPGGFQDQYFSAYGSLRAINFNENHIEVSNPLLSDVVLDELEKLFYLIPLGVLRDWSTADFTRKSIENNLESVKFIEKSANLARTLIQEIQNLEDVGEISTKIGEALTISNQLKSNYTIFPPNLERKLNELLNYGATGAKICGAGAGGYIFCIVPEHKQKYFEQKIGDKIYVKPGIDRTGVSIATIDWVP